MNAINGLRNLLMSAETLHGIEAPPERDDHATDDEYTRALDEHWERTTCWKTSIQEA